MNTNNEQVLGSITSAASTVMKALEDLRDEDRGRVLSSVAALYGINLRAKGFSLAANEVDESDFEGAGVVEDPGITKKRLSLVELLKQKEPVTNFQRIAVFAFYREKHLNQQQFSPSDLLPFFATAKLSKPGNYQRDFNYAVKEGWIHDDGPQSYLTQDGEKIVEAGFGGKAKPRGKAMKKAKAAAGGNA